MTRFSYLVSSSTFTPEFRDRVAKFQTFFFRFIFFFNVVGIGFLAAVRFFFVHLSSRRHHTFSNRYFGVVLGLVNVSLIFIMFICRGLITDLLLSKSFDRRLMHTSEAIFVQRCCVLLSRDLRNFR